MGDGGNIDFGSDSTLLSRVAISTSASVWDSVGFWCGRIFLLFCRMLRISIIAFCR